SVVLQVLATSINPFTNHVHAGHILLLNLILPLVPNPSCIARVHSVGADAVHLKAWDLVYRDGSLQQFQLENCFLLDDVLLRGDLKYETANLAVIPFYMVAASAFIEAANLKAGETVVVGPAGGTFGGTAVELALAVGANVIALGRDDGRLVKMEENLQSPPRFQTVPMTGIVNTDTAAILEATPLKLGVDVYNDWAPGTTKPMYLEAALHSLKDDGRAILSGGGEGAVEVPYALAVLRNLTIRGKWMCKPPTIKLLMNLINRGVVKIGRPGGAVVTTFDLEDSHAAIEHVAQHGRWRNYTVICPNSSN
ncbi:hypothetical protein DPV78_004428, partial [Talaromyces pinophilus]